MELIDKNELLEKIEELKQNLSASPIVVIEDVESLVESLEVKEDVESLVESLEVKEVDLDESARHHLLHEHISPLNEVLHHADIKVEMQYHTDIENAFKAGAKWQKEQYKKAELKYCASLTTEEAEREINFVNSFINNEYRVPTFSDAIEYGKKQMVDEACDFIRINAEKHVYFDEGNSEWYDSEEFVEDFKNYMKGK